MKNIIFFLIISLFYGVFASGQTEGGEVKPPQDSTQAPQSGVDVRPEAPKSASEAEGKCLSIDCVEQGQIDPMTVSQIHDLAVTNCTALINSSACAHIPEKDRKVCSSDPQSNLTNDDDQELDLLEGGKICLVESFSSISDILSFIGEDISETFLSAFTGMEEEEELSVSLYLNAEFERTYENSEGAATKRATLALSQMTSSFFSLLYDAITEEFPCLNERASVRESLSICWWNPYRGRCRSRRCMGLG